MSDYDAAIGRQSERPFEARERQQVRYILERFWSSARYQQRLKRIGIWVSGALGVAVSLTQMWAPLEKFLHLMNGGTP